MYRENGHTSIMQNMRIVAHATLDNDLNILSFSPELAEWAYVDPATLANFHLFDLFPQLVQSHKHILKSQQIGEDAFVYQNAYFVQSNQLGSLVDLQIETFPESTDKMLLSVMPQTAQPSSSAPPPANVESRGSWLTVTQHNHILQLLNRANQMLTATQDSEELLSYLLQIVTQHIPVEHGTVWLWEDDTQKQLVCRAAVHSGTEIQLIGKSVASGAGIVGQVAESGQSMMADDLLANGRFYLYSKQAMRSILAVPIHLQHRVLGVLAVVNKINGRFLPEDQSFAEILATFSAVAIDNAQRIEQLQQKMADLEVQNNELEAFDHTVAHNLKNPLALVVGFTELLQNNEANISKIERDHALSLLVQNTHRMSSIIQELLMLSSVRKSDIETHPLDMNEIVSDALDRLRFMMQQHNAHITLPDSWKVARGYAPWIEEVWDNYISNALKYGGNPPQIELGNTVLADGRIQFWVRDNGQGIPKEKQAHLFTPFTQLNQTSVSGHGLGLSIVRRIIEKLGGEVGFQSQPGQGSTFSFTLPLYILDQTD